MTPISKQLIENEVINLEKIKEIKESINVRYPSSTSKEKARLLAKAIHDIIEGSVPDFSKDIKVNIRKELLKRNLSANSFTINANDIVEASMELVALEDVKNKLPQWLKSKVDIELDLLEAYIETLVNSKHPIEEIAVQPIDFVTKESELSSAKQTITTQIKFNRKSAISSLVALIVILLIATIGINKLTNQNVKYANVETKTASELRPANELPSHLQYETIDEKKLRTWLEKRDSMLAGEPYFSTIIEVADEFNIHPLLLFAITGQEQGFVPKTNKHAIKVANNPYNVFHSWKEYNTNILDSTQIAARTITNLSKDRPEDVHPIKWINRKYAEDQNWWKGVSSIFDQLENDVQ